MDSTASINLEAGTILVKRYCIEKVLGQGGMGAVYLARDSSLGDKAVAIKEMRVTAADDKGQQQALAQFRQEAQFLAQLEHPNLVHVSDFFAEEGRHYLVMALVKGQSLAEMLQARRGAFPVARVLDWGRQLASVLTYLHKQDPPILFRDLKPSNIMLDGTGSIRLIDFGIARSFNPDSVTATFLQGMGSAGYSPLEQYQGAGGTDPRSDIYALGATLFHLLTNRVPPSPVELVTENKPMPSARRWNPTLAPALDKILCKMMAVRKDDRYQTMEQVQGLLEQVARALEEEDANTDALAGLPGQSPSQQSLANAPTRAVAKGSTTSPMMPEDPNSRALYMTIGILVVSSLALFGWLYQSSQPTSQVAPRSTSGNVVSIPTSQPVAVEPSPVRRDPVAVHHSSSPSPPRPPKKPPVAVHSPKPLPSPVAQTPVLPSLGEVNYVPVAPRRDPKPVFTPPPMAPPPTTPQADPPIPQNPPEPTVSPGNRWRYQGIQGWVWLRTEKKWHWEMSGPTPPRVPRTPASDGQMPDGQMPDARLPDWNIAVPPRDRHPHPHDWQPPLHEGLPGSQGIPGL